jgi:single-strand DNA-binding protein
LHYFDDKNCVGRFPLATNESYVNKQTNERVTNTEWHNIVVRNKAAEICEKYLSKGDKVYIEGRIKTRKWQDDKGLDRFSTEIQCKDFTFLSTKNENALANVSSPPVQSTNQNSENVANAPLEEDDDLPF